MNSLLMTLGIEDFKPLLTTLLLPPVPWLFGVLIGARLILPRRGLGWLVVVLSVIALWLSSCLGFGRVLETLILKTPPALSVQRLSELGGEVRAQNTPTRPRVAIVVLGGGRERVAPEYGTASLTPASIERLRYGLWLARQTGAPVAYSGGIGWGSKGDGASEAEIAARLADQEWRQPLRWMETQSRDTEENARFTLSALRSAGVKHLIIVTHAWHMPRALHHFEQQSGGSLRIEAAPMGITRPDLGALEWLPTTEGATKVRQACREIWGQWLGA